MKVLSQLPVPQDTNTSKFPSGTIQNETDIQQGTPVIRELYGDILTNLYKILDLTKEVPDGNEDTELTQYQLVNAFKKWTNDLNDKEQILSLNGTVWSVPFDLSILPDKYVFIAIASDTYNSAVSYTFKGTEVSPVYPLTSSTGFNSSDEIMVIIDQTGVRVISLTQLALTAQSIYTGLGQPLAFNSLAVMKYNSNGKILDDTPSVTDLQIQIRTLSGDSLAEVYDMVILKDYVLCFTFLPGTTTYKFYQFALTDLNTAILVPVTGIVIPVGSDNGPFMYTDGTNLFITNAAGTTANDNDISKLSYTPGTPNISFISTVSIDAGFQKTSNVVIKGNELFTLIDSILKKYNLGSGTETVIDDYDTIIGVLFQFNGEVFHSTGEVATKWTI